MLKAFRSIWDFADIEASNIHKSILFGILVAIGHMIQLCGIYLVVNSYYNGAKGLNTAWEAFALVVLGVFISCFAKGNSQLEQTHAGYFMVANKRINIANHIKTIPMGYFNENSHGELAGTMTTVLDNVEMLAPMVMVRTMEGLITTAVMLVCVMVFDYRFGILILLVDALYLIIASFMEKKSRSVAPLRQESEAKMVSAVLEQLKGMSIVKSFNLTGKGDRKLAEALEYNRECNTKMEGFFMPFTIAQKLVLQIGTMGICFLSVKLYLDGTLSGLYAIMMTVMSFVVFANISSTGSAMAILRLLTSSMEKANEPEKVTRMDVKGGEYTSKDHSIELKNVSFSYENKKVLDNVSFTIPDKTTTAIVGPSGSGKTTLCNLIARFWDIDAGEIYMGGKNIKEYTLDALMDQISMVFQDVYLFADTIENNIKFGVPNASHERVVEAAKKACCDEFINALPEGYNTMIGEGGASLSGGEKQRISIARAILKDAPIIILDEATANVDPENEDKLQKAIESLTKDKTIIMIAHRLKTVRNANQILVINDGKIVEQGNHDKLINEDGIYKKFIEARKLAVNWKL